MEGKCRLVPDGKSCYFETKGKFHSTKCIWKNISTVVQEFKWSLPLGLGNYFKRHEAKVKCDTWKC